MESFNFPTWKDVELPEQFIQVIKSLNDCYTIEQLICEKVFHYFRRLQYVYICGVCGFQYKAQKSIDDYALCTRCQSRAIYATQYLKSWSSNYAPGCSLTEDFGHEVLVKMRNNYAFYSHKDVEDYPPEEIVTFNWTKNRSVMARFVGGELVEENNSPSALCKAALLVPFLWDRCFSWKICQPRPPANQVPLVPTLRQLIRGE